MRTGHHCCQPAMERFGVPATIAARLHSTTRAPEVDRLVEAPAFPPAQASRKTDGAHSNGHAPIAYPAATAKTVAAAARLADEFAFMDDAGGREAKSQFVLDTAKSLPHHFDLLQKVTDRIPGCMSQVYLVGREKPGESGTFEFVADADAEIVRGLIAILEQLYSGQKARDVAAFDIEQFFEKIG